MIAKIGTAITRKSNFPIRMEADHRLMNELIKQGVVEIKQKEINRGMLFEYIFDIEKFTNMEISMEENKKLDEVIDYIKWMLKGTNQESVFDSKELFRKNVLNNSLRR